MFIPDLSEPLWFIITSLAILAVLTFRYFIVAGSFYLFFYKWYASKWSERKLSKKDHPPQQYWKEIRWSLITSVIFSAISAGTLLLWQRGYTRIYSDVDLYGLWYLPLSLVISMLIHECYYYWTHRWMHQPRVFRIFHKVHHNSKITSPWTAFSFHPLEGLVQAIILPIILIILPMHPVVILIQLMIMSVSSVINHLDIEIYPQRFQKHPLGRMLIGATHHAHHHKKFKENFGLYFTFMDQIFGTEYKIESQKNRKS